MRQTHMPIEIVEMRAYININDPIENTQTRLLVHVCVRARVDRSQMNFRRNSSKATNTM